MGDSSKAEVNQEAALAADLAYRNKRNQLLREGRIKEAKALTHEIFGKPSETFVSNADDAAAAHTDVATNLIRELLKDPTPDHLAQARGLAAEVLMDIGILRSGGNEKSAEDARLELIELCAANGLDLSQGK